MIVCHLIEISVWAAVYVWSEALPEMAAALYFSAVTYTTTGYGDVVPQTVGGKMIGSVVMVSGILVLALMTGILATGFAEEERRREYLRVWDQVTRVPMFAELGTVTLSEIVSKLRVRHYPPRIVVVRRDEPGDSMFFISEGEVDEMLRRFGKALEETTAALGRR